MITHTENGKIRCIENISPIGTEKYQSFLGIPYAKPSIGGLRFSVIKLMRILS